MTDLIPGADPFGLDVFEEVKPGDLTTHLRNVVRRLACEAVDFSDLTGGSTCGVEYELFLKGRFPWAQVACQ
jgi:hypothetical protein